MWVLTKVFRVIIQRCALTDCDRIGGQRLMTSSGNWEGVYYYEVVIIIIIIIKHLFRAIHPG